MPIPKPENRIHINPQGLAGMIADMPDEVPPPGITAAVMRQIQPKRISWRRKFVRRLMMPRPILPVQAVSAIAVAVLLVGGLAFLKGFNTGREQLPATASMMEAGSMAVAFVLDRPTARKVTLIGSFNNWNPEAYQMHRDNPQAPWRLSVDLPHGKYQYAFLIDDQKVVPDPNALWLVDDGFGNLNSTLIVENGTWNAHES